MRGGHHAVTHWVDLDVGRRVRTLRKEASITQAALAAACGITFQQIQKYEKGSNRISISMLWQIARALNLPLATLLPPENRPKESELGKVWERVWWAAR